MTTNLYLDGGEDPTFEQVDEFLREHFNARAVYSPGACQVTATIKTASFRGQTFLFRCDREAGHDGEHHGHQPGDHGAELFWRQA